MADVRVDAWIQGPIKGVRVVHLPTGIVINGDPSLTQVEQRDKALDELRARLESTDPSATMHETTTEG